MSRENSGGSLKFFIWRNELKSRGRTLAAIGDAFLDFIEIPEKDDNESEVAKIFMWVLSKDRVSANKLKEKFEMGNRIDGIMEKLHMMGIISDKKAKQPRKVIPQTPEEVPEEVKKLLMRNHFTVEDISEVMKNRAVACT